MNPHTYGLRGEIIYDLQHDLCVTPGLTACCLSLPVRVPAGLRPLLPPLLSPPQAALPVLETESQNHLDVISSHQLHR